MTASLRSESVYDFSMFHAFFERFSTLSPTEAQHNCENLCRDLDRILYSSQTQLPFFDVCFLLCYKVNAPSRFSYLGRQTIRRDPALIQHLHEVYYIAKYSILSDIKKKELVEIINAVRVDAQSLFDLVNCNLVQDFFDISEHVDFNNAYRILASMDESSRFNAGVVKKICASYFCARFFTKIVYYVSRKMCTDHTNFFQDFQKRFEFTTFVSREFLPVDIFDGVNFSIIYNHVYFAKIWDLVLDEEKKSLENWSKRFMAARSEGGVIFLDTFNPTELLDEEAMVDKDILKLASKRVYEVCAQSELERCNIFIQFKEFVTRSIFHVTDTSDAWMTFSKSLRETNNEIPYTFKFLTYTRNFVVYSMTS